MAPVRAMPDDAGGTTPIRLVIEANAMAVRAGLQRLFAANSLSALSDDARGSAEIVLAEVLNNIVEHAYARWPGMIDLTIGDGPDGLTCRVEDDGLPMPGGLLSGVTPPGTRCADPADLPEGGFGWPIICTLSHAREYHRVGDRNRLTLVLATEAPSPSAPART